MKRLGNSSLLGGLGLLCLLPTQSAYAQPGNRTIVKVNLSGVVIQSWQ
ncbi:hypothetical protein [Spirosoma areae]